MKYLRGGSPEGKKVEIELLNASRSLSPAKYWKYDEDHDATTMTMTMMVMMVTMRMLMLMVMVMVRIMMIMTMIMMLVMVRMRMMMIMTMIMMMMMRDVASQDGVDCEYCWIKRMMENKGDDKKDDMAI